MVLNILLAIVGLIVGLGLGFVIAKSRHDKAINGAKISASSILENARKESETLKKEALLEAKEENQKYRSEIESELKESRLELKSQENRLIQREQTLDRKDDSLEKREGSLEEKEEKLGARQQLIDEREKEVENLINQQHQELERIASLSKEEAKSIIMKSTEEELNHELTLMVKESEQRAKEESDRKAKNLLSLAIQRCAADSVSETTVSVVTLPNDEMKGRIIGREGRNIRALETLTGVDLIIDDTPEAVVLSSFDPVRREIAKLALEKLIVDGRIHPVRIEEMVEKAQEEIDKKIWSEGENAALEMGVMGLNKELIKTLGRLYYRTSYGQNVLKHSLEVGHIAGMLAAEIGANEKIAKRAGLLHDIGKAVDQTQEGTHIQLGVELAARFGERPEVIHAIEAHHDDVVANTIEAVLVKVADAISAGRPGARRDTLEIYIKRLQKIEEIVNSFDGIKQSFAVQAGREVRIIVESEKFDDLASQKLARDVAKRIEDELDYPGQIRVTVVREFRTTEIAK